MARISLFIIAFIMGFYFLTPGVVIAQTTIISSDYPTRFEGNQSPDVIHGRSYSYTCWNFYRLKEDLTTFEMSTLARSTEYGYAKEGSTLGTRTKRPSNIQVNNLGEKKQGNENAERTNKKATIGLPEAAVGYKNSNGVGSSFSVYDSGPIHIGGSIYMWVNENGVLHLTNNLGSVPFKHQEKIVSRR